MRDGADRAGWDDKRMMGLNGGGCCSGTRPDGLLDRLMAYVNMVRLGKGLMAYVNMVRLGLIPL